MKHYVKAAVILVFIVGLVCSAFAQTDNGDKKSRDLYVKTVFISKVYPYSDGYKVEYLTANGKLKTTYIPMKWFYKAGGKAELINSYSSAAPYMDVVYADGAFLYVRLVLYPDYNHPSWGAVIASDPPVGDKFNVDSLTLEY